jgi:Ca2+-binding EF-hand superfamily protein
VSKSYLIAAGIALAGAAPALAIAAPAAPRPAPRAAAPASQPPLTRTAIGQSADATFKAFDTNNDGVLSQAELAAAELKVLQQRVAVVHQRLDGEFTKLDTNHDGQLSKAEFMAAAPQTPTTGPNGSSLLGQLDKNHDGKVSPDEFRNPRLAQFDALDSNHDGVISDAEKQAAQAKAPKR